MNYPKCYCFQQNTEYEGRTFNAGEGKAYEIGRLICHAIADLMREADICQPAQEFVLVTTFTMLMQSHALTMAKGDEAQSVLYFEKMLADLAVNIPTRNAQLALKVKQIMEVTTQ